MPDSNDIEFVISIPINEQQSSEVINAFLQTHPYNSVYQPTIIDNAGNTISNPITPEMFVEDCIAYYVMDITKNYLINHAADDAVLIAAQEANQFTEELKNSILSS